MRRGWLAMAIACLFVFTTVAKAQNTPTALSVIDGFMEAGIPIIALHVFDETTDPLHLLGRPGQYIEMVAWHDDRRTIVAETSPATGSIERFATRADMERRLNTLRALDGTFLSPYYRFTHGLMILRISYD